MSYLCFDIVFVLNLFRFYHYLHFFIFFCFFFNDTATTEIYTYYTLFPYTALCRSRAPGALVANQLMLHPLRVPVPSEAIGRRIEEEGFLVVDGEALNPDQWDGYPAARDELVGAVGGQGGVVVLTGDVHSSWAWEGPATDSGAPACVELVAPSVSSGSFATRLPLPAAVAERAISALDDDLSFIEIESHGRSEEHT